MPATADSLTLYVPGRTGNVTVAPSPAAGKTVTPLTIRSNRPGSSAGHSCFSTVRLAGTQLPKSRPVTFGFVAAVIGPQPQPKRPPDPSAKPPAVSSFGNEHVHGVDVRRRPGVASSSRSR